MSAVMVIGALLVIGGIVLIARAAIARGRLSDPHHNPGDTAGRTLEPRDKGVGFLGLGDNWPGLLLVALGGLLLLSPLIL
jgi:hypothetical protein